MLKGWVKRTELVVAHNIKVYTGPVLPFLHNHTLYLEVTPYHKHDELDGLVGEAMDELGISCESFEEISRTKMYYSGEWGKHFYLVGVELSSVTGAVVCVKCGFLPMKRDYAKAFLCIPLNPEVWDEYVCPSCLE